MIDLQTGCRKSRSPGYVANADEPTRVAPTTGVGAPRKTLLLNGMVRVLLESKLHAPRRRSGVVARPRLSARLHAGAASTLTLVSAPAGFGKTTLVAQWAADAPACAWLSLDHGDNDPHVFWTYVIAAMNSVTADALAERLRLLLDQPPPIDAVIAALVNELHALTADVVLVLDDYHVIESPHVHDGMAFFLEHLPPQLHVVIVGRSDPPLPLARLRARGELVEVRASDLRFTQDESAAYLMEAMGVVLAAHDVATLETRTEGWIAALQLAALSMHGRDDIPAFISGFAGDDRYIVDYLTEEVLQRQPEDVRTFLLHTSILDRLSAPLCDAVTIRDDSKAMLATLERSNLFLRPLDDRRRWYRYHQLFADVLRAHLLDERGDSVDELHRRASLWFEHHNDPAEAIHHAFAAEDFERAASLIELSIPAMRQRRQDATLRGWLERLPPAVVRVRPTLSMGLVGVLMASGEPDAVDEMLTDVERWIQAPSAEMIVVDEEGFRHLPAAVEIYRAGRAQTRGDVATTVAHALRAIDLSAEDDPFTRAAASGLLALASWTAGDLEAAHRLYVECSTGLERLGFGADAIGSTMAMADIRRGQGRLTEAMHTYEQALRERGHSAERTTLGAADLYVCMSEVSFERNDLAAATRQLRHAQELGEHNGLRQNRHRWRIAAARLRYTEGDPDDAIALLDDAARLYNGSDFAPNVRPIPALKARMQLADGRLREATAWVRARGVTSADELSYVQEFEHITLARVLIAQQRAGAADSLAEAVDLLERLLLSAQADARLGSVIEILLLQAVALQLRGDMNAAVGCLQRAVTLAEPEGHVRVFVDEGTPVATLLRNLVKQHGARSHAGRLLAAMSDREQGSSAAQPLIEPLSERELEVLRLLGTDLDGPEIARELVVSLHTIRTHTKHIYAKLGVNSRRAAVRQSRELNLLPRG